MSRYNNGIIFTNNNCIGCNKCITNCSLIGANVTIVKNGKPHMEIDSRKCNDCGKCINVCVHHARDFRDDTDRFFEDLKKGEKISLILEPSFYALYKNQAAGIIGCLKSIGVDKVYDGSVGREISAFLTVKYIKNAKANANKDRAFISNACPALVNVIQKYHPFLLSKLIPIQPSVICSAIYAHKYLGDSNKIASLGSCIANKDEVDSENTYENINYNLTYAHLMKKLAEYDFSKFNGESDLKGSGFGALISLGSGFSDIVSYFFPRTESILPLVGFSQDNMQSLYLSLDEHYKETLPLLVEISACKNGCIAGPGIDFESHNKESVFSASIEIRRKVYESYKDIENPEKLWKQISSQLKYIRDKDFARTYTDYSRQQFKIPQSAIDEIFTDMLKDTPQKRSINCGTCGYNSCVEMAKAIAYGYTRKESCIHYMNDLMVNQLLVDKDTGLMTALAFNKDGVELQRNNPDKSYIIAIGDVNKLKIINDLYGFSTGTGVLKLIAATLRQIAGDNGLVARFGGGTFAICMENNVDNLQRLQSCKIFDCSSLNMTFPVTMHFGIRITNESTRFGLALNQATLCMDYNISSVQNTFTAFTEKNIERTYLEADITSKMQPALAADEFKIWFQPQYSSDNEELVGAEALCRWIQADGSIISPGVFIPVAEKNGFIRYLDSAIWEKVFAKIREWLDQGLKIVPISINISRVSMESDRLYYIFKRLKEKYKVPENLIHVEITESAAVVSASILTERIHQLRDLGFQIAMDDFGSGYSSLNALKNMPIDILKLDMGFVKGGDELNRGGAIITYVTRMAQSLEYVTVAEGVETQKQADFLRGIGVNIFQGYLFSKPIPEEEFVELLKAGSNHGVVKKPRITGQIDIKKFFVPDSPESIMFEDYSGPSAIYEYDDKNESMILIRANTKYLTLFNLQNQAFREIRKQLRNLINRNSYNELIGVVKKCIETKIEDSLIVEIKRYGNEYPLWIKNHVWEISVVGHKHSVFFLAEDVTSEKLNENTLELANCQLGLLMEKSQVGMCLMHLDVDLKKLLHSMRLRVIRVNQMFENISGFEESEVLSWTEKNILSLIHPLDRPGFFAKCVTAIANKYKKPFTYTYSALTKSGYYKKVKIFVSGVRQPDKSYMIITNYVVLGNSDYPDYIDDANAGFAPELLNDIINTLGAENSSEH